jgi:SAM-dependent methyltransferase
MSIKDLAVVQAYHADRVERFGVKSVEALGWNSQNSQRGRFQQLARLGDFDGHSILDVGCGHADLYAYLKENHSDIRYTGIDYVSDFLDVAVQKYGDDSNAHFLLGEFNAAVLPKADFVICCGALNYRNSDFDYLPRSISRLFDACTIGVGLNLLREVDFPDGILITWTLDEVLESCRQLAPNVAVVDDPQENYFTVFLYHKGCQKKLSS